MTGLSNGRRFYGEGLTLRTVGVTTNLSVD